MGVNPLGGWLRFATQRLYPCGPACGRSAVAQILRTRDQTGVALFPRRHQLGQGLSMGLSSELFECQLRVFQGVALGAKCCVTQTRGFLPTVGAASPIGRKTTIRSGVVPSAQPRPTPLITARRSWEAGLGVTGAASTILAITKLARATGKGSRGLFLRARPVITARRNDPLGCGFGGWGWLSRGIGCSL